MPRVKGGYTTRRRRKKILKLAKGYYGSKHTLYKTAHEQVMRSLAYAYRDRKVKKRDFRKLWITRINAACKLNDTKYSLFINGLSRANVVVNRKMLAELAVSDPKAFADLVAVAKNAPKVKAEVVVETKVEAPKTAVVVEETVAEVVVEETAVESTLDLNSLKVAELRELAKAKGVSGFSTMKKAELIAALN